MLSERQLTGRPARRFRTDEIPAAIADRPEGRKRRREEAEPMDPPLYLADDEETDDD